MDPSPDNPARPTLTLAAMSVERFAHRRSAALRYGVTVSLLVALALTWTDFAARVLVPALKAPHWTNSGYWVAAQLAAHGRAGIIYGNQDLFLQETARLGAMPDTFEANMPTTLIAVLPLAAFNETTARSMVDVIMLACYILAFAMLMRILSLPPPVTLGLWAAAPLFHPWRENISRGQLYALPLALVVLSALLASGMPQPGTPAAGTGSRKGWTDVIAGAGLGLIAVTKAYYGLLLLMPFLVLRRGRTLMVALGVVVLAIVTTLVFWGGDFWVKALDYALTWRDRPESGLTAYQTLNGWLTHLFRYSASFNPRPVVDLPELVGWLWWIAAALLGVITLVALWRERQSPTSTTARRMLAPALMVPLALILAPIAEDYHFVLTLFPLAVAFVALRDMYKGAANPQGHAHVRTPFLSISMPQGIWFRLGVVVWLTALILLGAPWRFNVPSVGGWHSLLHYPRLYGALLLWALIIGLLMSRPRSSQVVDS